jgi:N-acyl homoserine lactone hydrolase
MKKLLTFLLILAIPLALLASTFSSAPLPVPEPFTLELPPASPPPDMAIFQLPTGHTARNAAFGYRGGSFGDKRDFAMTAVLVKHPRGDLLIDTGFGSTVDEQVEDLPWLLRRMAAYVRAKPAAARLDDVGYDRRRLRGIVLTHAHWDHVSGAVDFPDTPILVNAEERAFIRDGGFSSVVARNMDGAKYEEYAFDGGPYLGFPASRDIHGDGSVVLVPAPGHTPGSVIAFVTLPGGKRYAFVGDLVWQLEGITLREERPWLMRRLADSDEVLVRGQLLHVAAIAAKFPDLTIVPAHDARAFAGIPVLE